MGFATRLKGFTGEIPRVEPRLLPDNAAVTVINAFLRSGRVDPMYTPVDVGATPSSVLAKSVYRMFSGAADFWLSWDSDVNVVRSPVSGDATFKIAFTSDSFEPRQTNLALATGNQVGTPPFPLASYVLGVYPPQTALTATPTGGSGTLESRAYVYTFVTTWGEESAPSPVSTIASGYPNASWALTNMQTAPASSGTVSGAISAGGVTTVTMNTTFGLRAGEQITFVTVVGMTSLNATFTIASVVDGTHITVALTTAQTYTSGGTWARVAPHNFGTGVLQRIYRTATAADGSTNYYFVAQQTPAATYTDTVLGASLGGVLPTTTWAMPPTNLKGLISLPNGILCGFANNMVYLSQPYAPYAWPLAYAQTTDYPVVAVGAFGQSVVVGTAGVPYIISGADPAVASMSKASSAWPCLAKRGMVAFAGDVYFPTNLGLAAIGVNGERLVSDQLYSQIDWKKMAPSSFIAAHFDNAYYAAYNTGTSAGVVIISPQSGVSEIGLQPSAMWADPATGELYAQYSGKIWNLNSTNGAATSASWISKEFVFPKPINLGAAQINAVYTVTPAQAAAIAAWNSALLAGNTALIASTAGIGAAVNTAPLNTTAVNGSKLSSNFKLAAGQVTFTLWADGVSVYSVTVASKTMFRLPAGVKYDNARFQLVSNIPVEDLVIAETPSGMKAV